MIPCKTDYKITIHTYNYIHVSNDNDLLNCQLGNPKF